MEYHGGTVRKMRGFVFRGWWGAFTQAPVLATICFFPLAGFILTGGTVAAMAVMAYGGLLTMLAAGSATRESEPVTDMADSRVVQLALSVVVALYLNTIFVVAVFVGMVFHIAGYPALATFLAIMAPALDHALSRRGLPLVNWIAGGLIWIIQQVARLAEIVWKEMEFSSALGDAREQLNSTQKIADEFAVRAHSAASDWV